MKTWGIAGTVIGGLLCGATPAFAASVLQDRGATTFDPTTNLEWLDLTATTGQSYDSIQSGFGSYLTSGGYHLATENEVIQLFTDAGAGPSFPDVDLSPTPGDATYQAVSTLLALLGTTFTDSGELKGTGLTAGQTGGAGSHDLAFYELSSDTSTYFAVLFGNISPAQSDSIPAAEIGSFLVRTSSPISPTPLPTALPLFASALGVLGIAGAKRRTRRAG